MDPFNYLNLYIFLLYNFAFVGQHKHFEDVTLGSLFIVTAFLISINPNNEIILYMIAIYSVVLVSLFKMMI